MYPHADPRSRTHRRTAFPLARALSCWTLILALFAVLAGPARAFDTPAEYVVLMDYESGDVVFEKNGDELMAPASMSKLMTMVMLFDAIREGRVSLDDEFVISENAWRKGGAASGSSTMFAEVNSRVPVRDLIKGVIVQSGNDACIAIAEALAGSEEAFAARMTQRAREIGLEKATFVNATGWPDPGHLMTARELAKLARYIIETYPEFYQIYAMRSFTWNGITQQNRNPLLYMNMGADGLKTGHTSISGYGLTASAVRNGRRFILVVNGLESERQRAEEAQRLMDWAFREFREYTLLKKGQQVALAPVWQGEVAKVPLVAAEDVSFVMSREQRRQLGAKLRYDAPLIAPVAEGQAAGEIVFTAPGMPVRRYGVVAGYGVDELGFMGKAMAAAVHLVSGR